jgi:hypothetical protein
MPLRTGQEAVAHAGALLLVADLLEDLGQQVFGRLVVRFCVDQLIENLHGQAILALPVEFLALVDDLGRAAHHLDIERGRIARRNM